MCVHRPYRRVENLIGCRLFLVTYYLLEQIYRTKTTVITWQMEKEPPLPPKNKQTTTRRYNTPTRDDAADRCCEAQVPANSPQLIPKETRTDAHHEYSTMLRQVSILRKGRMCQCLGCESGYCIFCVRAAAASHRAHRARRRPVGDLGRSTVTCPVPVQVQIAPRHSKLFSVTF
jgi:hypothetical protein